MGGREGKREGRREEEGEGRGKIRRREVLSFQTLCNEIEHVLLLLIKLVVDWCGQLIASFPSLLCSLFFSLSINVPPNSILHPVIA